MKPPSAEITRRRPVWEALSEMFLDTKLDSRDHQHVARVLAQSGYSDDELQAILYREVYPVCIWNLRSIAGEWGMFDGAWLQRKILANENHPWRAWRILQWDRWMIREPWRRIVEMLRDERTMLCVGNDS
jgi:hypothetical protein